MFNTLLNPTYVPRPKKIYFLVVLDPPLGYHSEDNSALLNRNIPFLSINVSFAPSLTAPLIYLSNYVFCRNYFFRYNSMP
jgi:hypothetical protein